MAGRQALLEFGLTEFAAGTQPRLGGLGSYPAWHPSIAEALVEAARRAV